MNTQNILSLLADVLQTVVSAFQLVVGYVVALLGHSFDLVLLIVQHIKP